MKYKSGREWQKQGNEEDLKKNSKSIFISCLMPNILEMLLSE